MRTDRMREGKGGWKKTAASLLTAALFCSGPAAARAFAEAVVSPEPVQQAALPGAGGPIEKGEVLTVDRCVKIALEKHPSIIAGTHSVEAASSRVGQARSGYYPQISLSSDYSKYSLAADPTNTVLEQYAANATLSQSIFEFGKTWSQVTIEQRNRDAAREDLRDATNQVVLNVKGAYYSVLQAKKSVDVLADTVTSFEKHLEQAQAFFETGVKSKFDVTKAEVDLSTAQLNLIRGKNALRVARVTLNNAMGMPDAPEYDIEDDLSFHAYAVAFEEAVQKAYANRPDLTARVARKEAADESISLAQKGFLPALSGNANYTRTDSVYPPEQSGWSAGLTVTFPLFNGFLTHYQVREAKENFNVARANEESLRQQILLDVQQAYLNLHEAEERVGVAELSVRQAEESYDIAKGRYEAGVGSIIEETDALVALRNAKLGLISAQADYKVAEATLKRAMGEQ